MNTYRYKVKTIKALEDKLNSFFGTGEVGSYFVISFKNTECFIQFAINDINENHVYFEFGLPERDWSLNYFNLFTDHFTKIGYELMIDKDTDEKSFRFLRARFYETLSNATSKSMEVINFFLSTFDLDRVSMDIKLVGNFYGNRVFTSIDENYTLLKKDQQLGIIGKFIYKILKWGTNRV